MKGQQIEPARFHPFPARMPISVVQHLISHITSSEAVVLDPMAGSGTTLIAAKYAKRKSIGFDRDPLALLISKTATTAFNAESLKKMHLRVLERAQKAFKSRKNNLRSLCEKMSPEDREF
ncbi:MAG: DNA methyltransferase, partial [Thermoleophilia bacterium]